MKNGVEKSYGGGSFENVPLSFSNKLLKAQSQKQNKPSSSNTSSGSDYIISRQSSAQIITTTSAYERETGSLSPVSKNSY